MAGYPASARRFLMTTLLLLPFMAKGAQPDVPAIILTGDRSGYQVSEKLMILEDETNSLSFADVVKASSSFKRVTQKVVNLGPGNSTIWMKFRVENRTNKEWFLYIGAPYLKEVDIFKQEKNGKFSKKSISSVKPFGERTVLTAQMILPLDFSPGDVSYCYLRVRSNSVIRVPLEIATMQHILESTQPHDVANGFYFGLITALIVYNLFVFISIREKTYLYYVCYVLFVTLNIAYVKGYLLRFVTPDFPQANHSNYSGAVAFAFALLFTNSFLNTGSHCPKIKRTGWLFFALCVFSFCVTLGGQFLLGFVVNWILVVLFIVYSNLTGYVVLSKGFLPAKYYLMGFNILLAGIVVYMLKDNALLEENWFTEGSYQIGSGLEAITLSFALATKLNTFKKEKELSQSLALAQASLFSQQLIGSQESERKRVAAELHDSLGQSLGMVKNKVLMIKRDVDKPAIRDKQVRDLEVMVTETIQEVRNISYNLRPLHLELLGITQSIQSLLEDIMESGQVEIETDIELFDNLLSKSNEINVFRIVQECFNNIVKHSQATRAKISIRAENMFLYIFIEDNGIGMPVHTKSLTGFGMIGIRERLNILNGHLEILDNKPSGTVINIKILL